jgi:hypothetical protein
VITERKKSSISEIVLLKQKKHAQREKDFVLEKKNYEKTNAKSCLPEPE